MVFSMRTLANIYGDFTGPAGGDCGDKGTVHSYIAVYEELFRAIREKPINLLEIGVAAGHSMAMWRQYFPNAALWGIDIDPKRLDPQLSDGWAMIGGDITVPSVLDWMPNCLDVVIDDGSHRREDQLTAFALLCDRQPTGGIYCIEDVQDTSLLANVGPSWRRTVYDLRPQSQRHDDILIVLERL